MKKILLLATGGTIACGESKDGLTPKFTANSLLNYIPEIKETCEISAVQLFNIGSTNMQPEYWTEIANTIKEKYHFYDGFVITHGTDTMAYTSAALSYMLQGTNKAVVLTGAMKPIGDEKTDAKLNLIDSIRFACENIGGVFVVFNGRVINGTRAVKVRSKSYNAFESINYPYIANINGSHIEYNNEVLVEQKSGLKFNTSLCPDVFLLKLIPGTKPQLFDYLKKAYRGIVIESFGTGGLPFDRNRNILDKIKEFIDSGVTVVITTQCLEEGCDLSIYEVGQKVLENPIIPANDMTTEAAVTKLMWVLGQTKYMKKIKELFLTPVNNDITF